MEAKTDLAGLVRGEFSKRFTPNGKNLMVRSPGRINLIGEHTDYNEGFVLPSAIDRAIYLQISLRPDTTVNLYSIDFKQSHSFDLRDPLRKGPAWSNYLIGVVDQFIRQGLTLTGFDCAFGGDIPIGAGMSSSAAVEAGVAYGLAALHGFDINRPDLARIAQQAENEFVGVKCGIMDQFANLLSKGGSALHLDCRSLHFDYIPFTADHLKILLCDTGVKHELASSEYNQRRKECSEGVETIGRRYSGISSLRDVTPEMLDNCRDALNPVVYRRCLFVLEENRRVDSACKALRGAKYEDFGRLLNESHEGLKNMYEVSCRELDVLVDAAAGVRGVLGSRMMGGGFGGCTLNLVHTDFVGSFRDRISEVYTKLTGARPKIYECGLTAGTSVISD